MTDPQIRHPDRLFIGGAWVPAHSGRMIEQVNPNTEEVFAAVAEADEADIGSSGLCHGKLLRNVRPRRSRGLGEVRYRQGRQNPLDHLHQAVLVMGGNHQVGGRLDRP